MMTINGKVFDYVDLEDEKRAYCSCNCAEEDGAEDIRRLYEDEHRKIIEAEGNDSIGETCSHCGAVLDCCGDGDKSVHQLKNTLYPDSAE